MYNAGDETMSLRSSIVLYLAIWLYFASGFVKIQNKGNQISGNNQFE